MEYVELTPGTITAIKREFFNMIKEQGLVLVTQTDAELINKAKATNRIMRRNHVSPYVIEKYQLLNKVKTRQSVVNMIERGDFGKENTGWFKDSKGNYQVLTSVIKQINNG